MAKPNSNNRETARIAPMDFQARNYLKRLKHSNPRQLADKEFENAALQMIRAFNLTEDGAVPWSFSADTKASAEELCRQLTELFHDSKLTPRADRLTRRDPGFQQFIGKLTH